MGVNHQPLAPSRRQKSETPQSQPVVDVVTFSGEKRTETPMLTERFYDALRYAGDLHKHQLRKGEDIPYFSHLMGVASLVLEYGGDEEEAMAGLLHDAVEDQGGLETLEVIREKFGNRVADIVDGCTDAYVEPKPPWEDRKNEYLDHLRSADDSNLLVSACDKLYNARTIVSDLRRGQHVFEKFSVPKEKTLWYYRNLVKAFQEAEHGTERHRPVILDLADEVKSMHELAGVPYPED